MGLTTARSNAPGGVKSDTLSDESSATVDGCGEAAPERVHRKQVLFADKTTGHIVSHLAATVDGVARQPRPPLKPNYYLIGDARPGHLVKLVGLKTTEYNGTTSRLIIYRKRRKRWGVKLLSGEVVAI